MALIKLTMGAKGIRECLDGQKVYVNTSQITCFYREPEKDATVVVLSNERPVLYVTDTPEKIAAKIESAEHTECRL